MAARQQPAGLQGRGGNRLEAAAGNDSGPIIACTTRSMSASETSTTRAFCCRSSSAKAFGASLRAPEVLEVKSRIVCFGLTHESFARTAVVPSMNSITAPRSTAIAVRT